jgi:hypothetical protein
MNIVLCGHSSWQSNVSIVNRNAYFGMRKGMEGVIFDVTGGYCFHLTVKAEQENK